MSLNKKDRDGLESFARDKGYSWNSKGTAMTDGHGGSIKFSDTGNSVRVNNSQSYSQAHLAKKSSKW